MGQGSQAAGGTGRGWPAGRSRPNGLRRVGMGMGVGSPRRGEVYLVSLDPTRGSEIRKTRPCVVVSPDELNDHLGTFLVAPMTTGGHPYPFRIACRFGGKVGYVVADQLRTVDEVRAGAPPRETGDRNDGRGLGCCSDDCGLKSRASGSRSYPEDRRRQGKPRPVRGVGVNIRSAAGGGGPKHGGVHSSGPPSRQDAPRRGRPFPAPSPAPSPGPLRRWSRHLR